MIDREHRDQFATVIRRYLNDEITAFELDDTIYEMHSKRDDPTITFVATQVWLYYDDLKDHQVHLSHEGWDYFQRLLLLLESDAEVIATSRWVWCPPQLPAVFALLAFFYMINVTGFGLHLFVLAIPLGVLSILLSIWRRTYESVLSKQDISLYPFASFAELYTVRQSVPLFKKRWFPPDLQDRRVRSDGMERLLDLQHYTIWLLLSPIALFAQALPIRAGTTRVRVVT